MDNLPKYFAENERLDSFKHWPFGNSSPCNILQMAEAGFYWEGSVKEPDSAACFMCHKVLNGWEEQDDPWQEHKKHAPQCVFVKIGKKEDEYTVEEHINLLIQFNKTSMEKYKKMCLKYKAKLEDLKENIILKAN